MSSINHSVNFIPNDVYQELVNLDISKVCGPDHITPKLPKLSAEFIKEPLSQLFNPSMSAGTLPRDWTTANVIPIYKKGESYLVSNYRLSSFTSIVVKVMKKNICKQLISISALMKSKCISDNQFEFSANHSRVTGELIVAVAPFFTNLPIPTSGHQWQLF